MTDIACITQDPKEPAPEAYLAVCTGRGDLIADSVYCPPECGGHPVCRPCYDLGVMSGHIAVSPS